MTDRQQPADDACGCPAYDPVENAHTGDQHTDCGGIAYADVPCGGCDSCISAQVDYYRRKRAAGSAG